MNEVVTSAQETAVQRREKRTLGTREDGSKAEGVLEVLRPKT